MAINKVNKQLKFIPHYDCVLRLNSTASVTVSNSVYITMTNHTLEHIHAHFHDVCTQLNLSYSTKD